MVCFIKCAVGLKLSDCFVLLLNGCFDGYVHVVAIFATFIAQEKYLDTLIDISLVLQEDHISIQHLEFINESLQEY